MRSLPTHTRLRSFNRISSLQLPNMSKVGEAVSPDGADNVGLAPTANTATAPSTKRGENRKDERTDFEAEPPSSNAWNALTPADPQPERVVPMTAEDELHMREDLGRDPEQLLSKQTENVAHLQERRDQLNQAAPGQNLDEMAAAGAVGIDPSAAAEAAPKPTAEAVDSNRLDSEEGKNTPDVFVRKETGT